MKDKREMIGSALREMMPEALVTPEGRIAFNVAIIRLAKQAIVIECEVEHRVYGDDEKSPRYEATNLFFYEAQGSIEIPGHHGTPGKALAIIVPLEIEP